MIGRLLDQIVAARPADWPEMAVVTPPSGAGLAIVLLPGTLEITPAGHQRPGEPQPREYRHEIALALPTRRYTLGKTPLPASLRCLAVTDPGKATERRLALNEGQDYRVDLAGPAIELTPDGASRAGAAAILRLDYSFVAAFALREFRQTFYADVTGSGLAELEKWASLLVALILTDHDALVAGYNAGAAPGFSGGGFLARAILSRITMLEATPDPSASPPAIRLAFQATGQMELGKEAPPEYGVIEHVVSPGVAPSDKPVDIRVGTDLGD